MKIPAKSRLLRSDALFSENIVKHRRHVCLVLVASDEEGLHDVDGQVDHDQEGEGVAAPHQLLVLDGVTAPPADV